MKRYIFLDIDGVLNHGDWYDKINADRSNWEYHPEDAEFYAYYHLDPHCIELLNQLSPAQVVITSSWRYEESTISRLKWRGLKLDIIGGTEHYHLDWIWRGNEILKWLCELPKDENYEYVIFDDSDDMLPDQNFILISEDKGLTQHDIDEAKRFLKLDEDG